MLVMGGQACVFYGGAEFSRDLDLMLWLDAANAEPFERALRDLEAVTIAVPEFDWEHLRRGHAVHFRCGREDVRGLRIDVMGESRGVARFEELWERRTVIEVFGEAVDLLGIEDLVLAKKTQRDRDWPMIRRLVERSYFDEYPHETAGRRAFWFRQLRTPELLIELVAAFPEAAALHAESRPLIGAACAGDAERLRRLLEDEEREERARDREYWQPLRLELEQLRRNRR